MGTISNVINAATRPVGVHEFAEALRAICPPRFNTAGKNIRRMVGLAVSGGVDSMALAFLCSQLKIHDGDFMVSDNPVSHFRGFIVDHSLREGSDLEALDVRRNLRAMMGMSSDIYTVSWKRTLAEYGYQYKNPNHLPNVESLARRLRYQTLGRAAAHRKVASLIFAHHEDDQYETVLMRLLQGHGVRGLRGMKTASDIPECEGIHGAYQSGFVDDQKMTSPYYSNHISKRQYKALKSELRSGINRLMVEEERRDSYMHKLEYDFDEIYHTHQVVMPDMDNVDAEDGGIMIYRPLLGFSKDRLIATCEANGITWFEDHTNRDPTLTPRNAIRHMYQNFTLPVALQKPAILALSQRCEKKARVFEAEADRLLEQTVIHDLELHVGTATVQFPEYNLSRFPRDLSSPARRRARIMRQREVIGHLIKKVIALVSPEEQTVPITNLQNVISRLFPALSVSADDQVTEPPKAFVIAGIHFVPVPPSSHSRSRVRPSVGALTWYLSRTPYPTHLPLPRYRPPSWSMPPHWGGFDRQESKWTGWSRWGIWDGRFWLRTTHRLPYRVILQPFLRQHAKKFRELLSPEDRDRLGVLLKRYAPGKTRYTLPALYLEEELDLTDIRPRPFYPIAPSQLKDNMAGVESMGGWPDMDPESRHPGVPDVSKMMPIALPSLDIQIPHLEDWLEYEIRFRRVDRATLGRAGSFHRGSFVSPSASSSAARRPPRRVPSSIPRCRYRHNRRRRRKTEPVVKKSSRCIKEVMNS